MNVCKLTDNYYYYKEPIGFGSFSIIYKGYRLNSSVPLAIKCITKIIDMKYFHNEVELMKKVDHPNILKLLDVVKMSGKIYLILEYCNSGDLSSYISNSKSRRDDLKYFQQIFLGLEYLYDKKILHRDIKPHNILIKNGVIKISDFGFAKSFEKNELITTFCGSPLYMAPEIIKDKEYNSKSDIWSLGVIIYELFARIHPYYVDSRQMLWDKIKTGIVVDYSPIDNEDIVELLSNMLIDNPDNRIDWDVLFNKFRAMNYNEAPEVDEFMFNMESDSDTYPHMTQSEIVPKKYNFDDVSYSVNIDANDNSLILQNDDYRIISRSAPNNLGKSYMENYIKDRPRKTATQTIPILGNSPSSTPASIAAILSKSIKTVRSMMSFW